MKTMRNLLLAGIIAAYCCSIGNAQTIYFNAFSGGATTIDGTAPTIANNFAGGTSSATWNDVLGIDPAVRSSGYPASREWFGNIRTILKHSK